MKKLFLLSGFLVLLSLHLEIGHAFQMQETLRGTHYTKGEYIGRYLYLSSLQRGYTLEKRPEMSPQTPDLIVPPAELDVRAFILKENQIVKAVHSLHDLQGVVQINSPEEAIEFVRLRTSGHTYFLFRPDMMVEVFKQPDKELRKNFIYGGCSPDFFEQHNLQDLEIIEEHDYFVIRRYTVGFSWSTSSRPSESPTLYKIIEKIYQNGQYEIEKKLVLQNIDFFDIPYPGEPY